MARKEAIRRAGYRCERCGSFIRCGRLEVHHRIPLADGGAPFAQSNLRVLGRDCHFLEHGQTERRSTSTFLRNREALRRLAARFLSG